MLTINIIPSGRRLDRRKDFEMKYYIVKKDGKEFRCETKAGAFEMYDCLGRLDVAIESHMFDTDASGKMKEYVWTYRKMMRRTLKSGEMKYYFR